MSNHAQNLINDLEKSQTKDEILIEVMRRYREVLDTFTPLRDLHELRVFLVDFNEASREIRSSLYYTDSCMIVLEPVPIIILNAAFILDLETAFRSFDLSESLLSSQYLRSDEDLYSLVRRIRLNGRIRPNPSAYLTRLRELERQEGIHDRGYIIETLAMIALFFICHEIGHKLGGSGSSNYSTFLKIDAKLEDKVANAVIKLCRHTDEFVKYKFGLSGFERVVDKSSEIREQERKLSKEIEVSLIDRHKKWFDDEAGADKWATELLTGYLTETDQRDSFLADQYRYVAVKGLFVTALYTWYRDLLTFGEKMGFQRAPDGKTLSIEMMNNRETYIKAASLFGEDHRFTLLRAVLAIEAIIRSGSDFFDRQDDSKTIWWSRKDADRDRSPNDTRKWWQKIFVWWSGQKSDNQEVVREWWLKESLQRYSLLSIMMDTAVKIAHLGCSTGWILEVDRIRGSEQIFMMEFEPIDKAVHRLRRVK